MPGLIQWKTIRNIGYLVGLAGAIAGFISQYDRPKVQQFLKNPKGFLMGDTIPTPPPPPPPPIPAPDVKSYSIAPDGYDVIVDIPDVGAFKESPAIVAMKTAADFVINRYKDDRVRQVWKCVLDGFDNASGADIYLFLDSLKNDALYARYPEFVVTSIDNVTATHLRVSLHARFIARPAQPGLEPTSPVFVLNMGLNKTAFVEDERLVFWLKASEDCYVTVFDVFASRDSLVVLVPDVDLPQSFLKADVRVQYPPADSKIALGVDVGSDEPQADEFLFAVATKDPVPFAVSSPTTSGGFQAMNEAVPIIRAWLKNLRPDQTVFAAAAFTVVRPTAVPIP
jgi:hypothetical protein